MHERFGCDPTDGSTDESAVVMFDFRLAMDGNLPVVSV